MNDLTAAQKLRQYFDSQPEWLLIDSAGRSFALRREEIGIKTRPGARILITFLDDRGFHTWRIRRCRPEQGGLMLDLTRNFQKEHRRIRCVARVSAAELGAETELARLEKANRISGLLLARAGPDAELLRIRLGRAGGRCARITLEKHGRQLEAIADVSDTLGAEMLLSRAILMGNRGRKKYNAATGEIWIVAEKKVAAELAEFAACLRGRWRKRIRIRELCRRSAAEPQIETLRDTKMPEPGALWREESVRLKPAGSPEKSRTAREIISLAPDQIDLLTTRRGETLRYLGLPFVRIRKISGREECWFGIEREKRRLTSRNLTEFEKLLEDLRTYRRFDSPNKRHALYRTAPEAWLESLLRRNIKRLDQNLVLSPVYNQFRLRRETIDLLALRRDGRLVVIELKTAPDRETVFQAVGYWRQVERARRAGEFERAQIFGREKVAGRPAVIYLVAPALCIHRDLDRLIETVSREISICRFDLAANWREQVRVLQRKPHR